MELRGWFKVSRVQWTELCHGMYNSQIAKPAYDLIYNLSNVFQMEMLKERQKYSK